MSRVGPDISKPHPPLPFISRIVYFILAVAVIFTIMCLLGPKPARAACSSSTMMALAKEHADDMAARRSLDHRNFSNRAHRGARGEAVALASSEGQAYKLWLVSPPHAAILRMSGCRGVAHAGRYWVYEVGE